MEIANLKDRKSPTKPLLEMIDESMRLMKAYVNDENEGEIIHNGQLVNQHYSCPPTLFDVIQTIEATSESRNSYFRQLGSMVPDHISEKEFSRLFNNYEELRLKCNVI